jgi:hypothetical protein
VVRDIMQPERDTVRQAYDGADPDGGDFNEALGDGYVMPPSRYARFPSLDAFSRLARPAGLVASLPAKRPSSREDLRPSGLGASSVEVEDDRRVVDLLASDAEPVDGSGGGAIPGGAGGQVA